LSRTAATSGDYTKTATGGLGELLPEHPIVALAPARQTVRHGISRPCQSGGFAMPLQRGEILGYDFNRMVVDFTMLNQGETVRCAISTAAMDDLEGTRNVKADQSVCAAAR
jgi:Protein of unknown function (DUF1488)